MTPDDYSFVCNKMLNVAMKYLDTTNIRSYPNLDRKKVTNGNIIYKSAVADKSPITLAYTPAGTGKSALIKDRIKAVIEQGTPPSKILVLNMNIAKVRQMQNEMPDVNIMTFCDFTHGIFAANNKGFELSDINSIANMLRLKTDPSDTLAAKFINVLSLYNSQDRVVMASLFINEYLTKSYDLLASIGKIDYSLEGIICHNMMYKYQHNPYDVDTIIINSVHNMPIPILCSVIEYVNKYHCNLFMTGSPDETIYEFNMAYKNSMNVIGSYSDKNIGIIRLNQSKMSKSICDVLETKRTTVLDGIFTKSIDSKQTDNVMEAAFSPVNTDYIRTRLDDKRPILVIARSKSDIVEINDTLEKYYRADHPSMTVLNLADIQAPYTEYGTMLTKHLNTLMSKYTQMSNQDIGFELYNALTYMINHTESPYKKNSYLQQRNDLVQFIEDFSRIYSDEPRSVKDAVEDIISYESNRIQQHMEKMQNETTMDFQNADIILSTIHTAIDIRNNDVIVFLRNHTDAVDNSLYRTALSRANETEYIIFVNNGSFENNYQRYLKDYIKNQ